jgi:hypothetical protein
MPIYWRKLAIHTKQRKKNRTHNCRIRLMLHTLQKTINVTFLPVPHNDPNLDSNKS